MRPFFEERLRTHFLCAIYLQENRYEAEDRGDGLAKERGEGRGGMNVEQSFQADSAEAVDCEARSVAAFL